MRRSTILLHCAAQRLKEEEKHLYGGSISALLSASSVGNNTISAALVTTKDYIHPGCEVAVTSWYCHILHDVDGIHRQHLTAQVYLLKQRVDSASN